METGKQSQYEACDPDMHVPVFKPLQGRGIDWMIAEDFVEDGPLVWPPSSRREICLHEGICHKIVVQGSLATILWHVAPAEGAASL